MKYIASLLVLLIVIAQLYSVLIWTESTKGYVKNRGDER